MHIRVSLESLGHGGRDGRPVASARVGNTSSNSTGALVERKTVAVLVNPGMRSIRGTLTAVSKLLNLDHSPCSPSDHP